jgi:hypothetical protein
VWRTRSQLEIAIVEHIGWFNHVRLHSPLGYLPPAEHQARHQASERDPARTATILTEGQNAPAGLYALQPQNPRSIKQ